MAQVGDTIYLDYQLHDYSTDKYVRATIKADGIEMSVSPILVPHVGDGAHFYANNAILSFPSNTDEVAITYSVYSDAGLTNRLKRYGAARDSYRLTNVTATTDPSLVDKINQLANVFNSKEIAISIVEKDEIISAYIDDSEIVGDVVDVNEVLLAEIFDSEPTVIGEILENEITGTVLDSNI